jgi:hypothetical protein
MALHALSSERQYGYRTPDGVENLVVTDDILDAKPHARRRAKATGGVLITRTVTTTVSPWAVVEETS